MDQEEFYNNKLDYEIDAWDLYSALNEGEEIVVVDARSTEAFEREHILGAINLPHREMSEERTSELRKDVLYVVYCDGIGCNASTKGALSMTRLGFRVKELMGGLDWWKRDGYVTGGKQSTGGRGVFCGC